MDRKEPQFNFHYLVYDYVRKREGCFSFVKDPRLLLEHDDKGNFFRAKKSSDNVEYSFHLEREVPEGYLSGYGVKNAIQCCMAQDCQKCPMKDIDRKVCQKEVLNYALDYILRLEEHDERRKD